METNNTQTMVKDGVVYQAIPQAKAEIVVESATEVVDATQYDFERVNINEPFSIISYGSDVQRQIGEILESTAAMSVEQQKTYLSDEMLKKIMSFDQALEEAKRSQEQKEGLFKRLITKARIGLNDEKAKKEEEMKSYAGRFKDYTQNLELVCDNVSKMAQDALSDIQFRKDIANKLVPIIEKLEAMVEAGKKDKEVYDEETVKIGMEDQTPDGQAIVSKRTQLSNAFARQLNGIEKALVLYKAQIQQYQIQQNTSMTTVQEAYDFIDKQKPVLESQASVQIFNKQESDRLSSLIDLSQAANAAIENSARNLTSNVEKASELILNGGFGMDSIEAVMASIEEGVAIITNTKKQLIKKTQDEQAGLDRINERLEANKQELLEIIEDKSAAVLALEETRSKGHTRSLITSYTNSRLGSRK